MAVRQEDIMREFIATYKNNPCIWKVKSKQYMDKNKREEAYQLLVEVLKQINPDANTDVVKKKVNSMRSCFRKEYKKVEDSKRSGAGNEDLYTPTLWYFDLMMFLKDQEIPRNSLGTDDPDFITGLAQTDHDSDSENVEPNIRSPSTLDIPPIPSRSASVLSNCSSGMSGRQKKRKSDSDSILEVVRDKLQQSRSEDEFDVIGKNVAEKFRRLEPNMRLFAEKLINDTLFEAQLGTFTRYAHITIPQPLHHSTVMPPYADNSYYTSNNNVQTVNPQPITGISTTQYFSQFSAE